MDRNNTMIQTQVLNYDRMACAALPIDRIQTHSGLQFSKLGTRSEQGLQSRCES